jgi:ATP-dependent helicase/nuclease subunit B
LEFSTILTPWHGSFDKDDPVGKLLFAAYSGQSTRLCIAYPSFYSFMLRRPILINPAAPFWAVAARAIIGLRANDATGSPHDLSGLRVVVSAFSHAQLLKQALLVELGANFVPPRIVTLTNWCAQLPPESNPPARPGARLMDLYAELRQHAWLKKIFSARRNTDLLPLAQVLLALCDELTRCLLPKVERSGDHDGDAAGRLWQRALAQLSPRAQSVVSDETQLVWSIWQAQLDGSDPLAHRFRQMMQLARQADLPLVWIAPGAPDTYDEAFLQTYAERQDVLPILLDWRAPVVTPLLREAWPELIEPGIDPTYPSFIPEPVDAMEQIRLSPAHSMELEAQRAAQTVVDWIVAGKASIAVIAQDRVVARRLRALLERAQIFVADETGWKLSTTRAASAVSAWFEVVSTRAGTLALLDLLKSPFVFADVPHKAQHLMSIEVCLRNANVSGGWDAAARALSGVPAAQDMVRALEQQAAVFAGRKTLRQWSAASEGCLQTLGIWAALQADAAGAQVLALMQAIAAECAAQTQEFSFAEWRAFIGMQLESTSYIAPDLDRRVVMLTLSGAQLRAFDAVLMVGCDAEHLPSQSGETLFFANTVRRELGLATREIVQLRQLRDFASLLCSNREVVLSWQEQRDGEPNSVSAWISRLDLALQRAQCRAPKQHAVQIECRNLTAQTGTMPRPSAPALLPAKLSSGGYGSMVACPYQFFAARMLGLSGLDELSDMPEKRDYGDWLHQILFRYHETLRDYPAAPDQREALLRTISADLFDKAVIENAAALGFYVRWKKVLPSYLAWANAREADGWRFAYGERKFEKILRWGTEEKGGEILLHGRIDRVDEGAGGELALLDYKTRDATKLREKLKNGEDRQLAFYGILSGGSFEHAHYVPIDGGKDKLGMVDAPDYARTQQVLASQLSANLQALSEGAALPATGTEEVCTYCAVRGLCRKGAW